MGYLAKLQYSYVAYTRNMQWKDNWITCTASIIEIKIPSRVAVNFKKDTSFTEYLFEILKIT